MGRSKSRPKRRAAARAITLPGFGGLARYDAALHDQMREKLAGLDAPLQRAAVVLCATAVDQRVLSEGNITASQSPVSRLGPGLRGRLGKAERCLQILENKATAEEAAGVGHLRACTERLIAFRKANEVRRQAGARSRRRAFPLTSTEVLSAVFYELFGQAGVGGRAARAQSIVSDALGVSLGAQTIAAGARRFLRDPRNLRAVRSMLRTALDK